MPASEGNSGSPSALSNSNRIPAASIARRIAAMLLAMSILCTIAGLIGRRIKLHEGVYGKSATAAQPVCGTASFPDSGLRGSTPRS
jgi:hypothetical protein